MRGCENPKSLSVDIDSDNIQIGSEHTNTNTEEGECVRERNWVEHPRGFESKYIQSVHFIIYIFPKHAANVCTTGRRLGCGHAFIK